MTADFRPTMGYDWEIMLLDHDLALLPRPRIQGLVDRIAKELPYTHAEDQDGYYEHKVGVCRTFTQLYERTCESLGRLCELLREEGALPYSSGAPPVTWCFTGCHMHAGTHFEPGAAYALRNALTPYMPILGSLMGNSPIHRGLAGTHKSFRMACLARGDASIRMVPSPGVTEGEWGADVSSRYPDPTLEARVMDTPFSWRLACECATLWCALATRRHREGRAPDDSLRELLPEYIDNRYQAVRHGLQATLSWQGAALPAVELLGSLIDEVREELGELGLEEPTLIRKTLAKRRSQADFQLDVLRCLPDEGAYIGRYARLSTRPEAFEQYLDAAEPLPVLPPDSIDERIEAEAGRGAPRPFLESLYPATMVEHDRLLERLVRDGRLVREEGERPVFRASGAAPTRRPEADGLSTIDLVFRPFVADSAGAPVTLARHVRLCEAVVRRLESGYLLRSWSDATVGMTVRAGLGAIEGALEELFAACREVAAADDLQFAPMAQDVSRKQESHLWIAPRAFESAEAGLVTLARLEHVLPAFTALLANSYTERHPQFGTVKCGAEGPWIEWSWWGLIGRSEPWRHASNRQNHDAGTRVRWINGRLSLVVDVQDAPSSPRLVAEAATLITAVARDAARCTDAVLPATAAEATVAAENWVAAVVDGLQATFVGEDGETSPGRMVEELLAASGDALAELGCSPDDLALLRAMCAKRQTQADLQAALWALDGDDAARQARRARVSRCPSAFGDWLGTAATLPFRPHRTAEAIMLSTLGRETPLFVPTFAFPMPQVERLSMLERLEAEGRVRIVRHERRGLLLTRLDA